MNICNEKSFTMFFFFTNTHTLKLCAVDDKIRMVCAENGNSLNIALKSIKQIETKRQGVHAKYCLSL